VTSLVAHGELRTPQGRRNLIYLVLGCGATLTLYFALRHQVGAVTPSSAPSFYRFTFDRGTLLRNAAEYTDRACTFAISVCFVAWLILRSHETSLLIRRPVILAGVAWLVGGYAITMFLPVRSSLYSCLPSVGAAIVAAEVCSQLWMQSVTKKRERGLIAVVIIPVLCLPIYQARNHRWTDLAMFSQSVLTDMSPMLRKETENSWLVFIDEDRGQRVNLQSAFGALLGPAISLHAGRHLNWWVEPPLSTAAIAGLKPPCPTCPTRTFRVAGGHATQQ